MSSQSTAESIQRNWLLGLLAVAGIGAIARGLWLGDQFIADDEWHAIHMVLGRDIGAILSSFGVADHCIPLTLYYAFLERTIGLSDWGMRLPLLLAGIATVVWLPWAMRRSIGNAASLMLAALLATSPLLIYFARTARPYALSTLLALMAVMALWRYLQHGRRRDAVIYAAGTTMAAYFHLTVLIPLAIAGLTALSLVILRPGQYRTSARRLILTGAAAVAGLVILLAAPMLNDVASLYGKSGAHEIDFAVLSRASHLMFGSRHTVLVLALMAVCGYGVITSLSRQRDLTLYLALIAVLSMGVVAATGAMWISHPMVFVRYCLVSLVILLIFLAIGLTSLTAMLSRVTGWAAGGVSAILVLGVVVALGPLPIQYQWPNQWTGHARYQFDYDDSRNPYIHYLEPREPSVLFARLAARPGKAMTVIHAPWRYEWHFNPLVFAQARHRLHMRVGWISGFCSDTLDGELPSQGHQIALGSFIALGDVVAGASDAELLVIDRHPPWPERVPLDIEACIEKISESMQPPCYADQALVAFALNDDGLAFCQAVR